MITSSLRMISCASVSRGITFSHGLGAFFSHGVLTDAGYQCLDSVAARGLAHVGALISES